MSDGELRHAMSQIQGRVQIVRMTADAAEFITRAGYWIDITRNDNRLARARLSPWGCGREDGEHGSRYTVGSPANGPMNDTLGTVIIWGLFVVMLTSFLWPFWWRSTSAWWYDRRS